MNTPGEYLAQARVEWNAPWTENFGDDLRRFALAMRLAREAFAMIAQTKTFQNLTTGITEVTELESAASAKSAVQKTHKQESEMKR